LLVVYIGLVALGIPLLDAAHHPLPFLIYMSALTAVMIMVCWLKGEKPEWRWGKD